MTDNSYLVTEYHQKVIEGIRKNFTRYTTLQNSTEVEKD